MLLGEVWFCSGFSNGRPACGHGAPRRPTTGSSAHELDRGLRSSDDSSLAAIPLARGQPRSAPHCLRRKPNSTPGNLRSRPSLPHDSFQPVVAHDRWHHGLRTPRTAAGASGSISIDQPVVRGSGLEPSTTPATAHDSPSEGGRRSELNSSGLHNQPLAMTAFGPKPDSS